MERNPGEFSFFLRISADILFGKFCKSDFLINLPKSNKFQNAKIGKAWYRMKPTERYWKYYFTKIVKATNPNLRSTKSASGFQALFYKYLKQFLS